MQSHLRGKTVLYGLRVVGGEVVVRFDEAAINKQPIGQPLIEDILVIDLAFQAPAFTSHTKSSKMSVRPLLSSVGTAPRKIQGPGS